MFWKNFENFWAVLNEYGAFWDPAAELVIQIFKNVRILNRVQMLLNHLKKINSFLSWKILDAVIRHFYQRFSQIWSYFNINFNFQFFEFSTLEYWINLEHFFALFEWNFWLFDIAHDLLSYFGPEFWIVKRNFNTKIACLENLSQVSRFILF